MDGDLSCFHFLVLGSRNSITRRTRVITAICFRYIRLSHCRCQDSCVGEQYKIRITNYNLWILLCNFIWKRKGSITITSLNIRSSDSDIPCSVRQLTRPSGTPSYSARMHYSGPGKRYRTYQNYIFRCFYYQDSRKDRHWQKLFIRWLFENFVAIVCSVTFLREP